MREEGDVVSKLTNSYESHLLLRTGTVPIASIMRRLLTGYAVRFNPAFSGTSATRTPFSLRAGGRTAANPSSVRKIHNLSVSGSGVTRRLNVDRYAISRVVQKVENDQDLIEAVRKMLDRLETRISQH